MDSGTPSGSPGAAVASPDGPLIRNISDTALWAAAYRAEENERPDAAYRDPLARQLAGERGVRAIAKMPTGRRATWAWVIRTLLFDRFINEVLSADSPDGPVDMVINLAAGLDARPYRMDLRPDLRWIEVDLPDLIAYKSEILGDERPRCQLERVAMDLADPAARQALFERLGQGASNALIICEGILVYLDTEEVKTLAGQLAGQSGFKHWLMDIASPALLRMLQRKIGGPLSDAGAPLKFGPREGVAFYEPLGWKCVEAHSMIKAAAEIKRLSLLMRLFAGCPDPVTDEQREKRPWSAVCLLERM